jgi:hypothetical protein
MKCIFITLTLLAAALLSTMPVSAACTATVPATTPDSRFSDNGEGTVTDIRTGLVWKRCSEGQSWDGATCTETASTYTWQTALQAGADSAFAGKSDWRLPNSKELDSIVERQCYSPAINSTIFPNTPSLDFWSGSPYAGYSGDAWGVSFGYGADGHDGKGYGGYVRLVRGGQ